MKKFVINSTEELYAIGAELLSLYNKERIFVFNGAMGAGKTTFIKVLCELLDVEDTVNSPTFSIVNEYVNRDEESFFHFDFYRLEKPEEATHIGVDEYFYSGSFCFIEWPEKIGNLLPEKCVYVNMGLGENDSERIISFDENLKFL